MCLKQVYTVKVIMFSQLIPLRPTCPIIIDCMNEITQWLSSFHWPTKLLDLGTLGGEKERDVEGTIWHSLCCSLWIIILCKLVKWAHLSGVISRHLNFEWRGYHLEEPVITYFKIYIGILVPNVKITKRQTTVVAYCNYAYCLLSLCLGPFL